MRLEEFDCRIAQIKEILASTESKLEQAYELHTALDKKLDRLSAKLGGPLGPPERATNRNEGV